MIQRRANRLFYWSLSHVKPKSRSAEYEVMGILQAQVVTGTCCAALCRATSCGSLPLSSMLVPTWTTSEPV